MNINFIYPLILTELLLLMVALSVTKVDYTSPCVITCAMFFLSGVCALYNVNNWDVVFTAKTYGVVTSALVLCIIVEFLFLSLTSKRVRWIDQDVVRSESPIKVSRSILIGLIGISFIFTLLYVREVQALGGGGLSAIATVKMEDDIQVSSLGKVALRIMRVMPYPCVFIISHNVVLCRQRVKRNLALIIPVLLSAVVTFFSGSRGPYVYIVLSTYVYVIMFERYKNGWRHIDIKKYRMPLIVSIIVFVLIFMGTRTIVKGHEFSSTAIEYLTFYFGSPIHLLNKIIDDIGQAFPVKYRMFGANTFASLYEEMFKFGFVSEKIHLNQTRFIAVGGNFIGGGNVFTFLASPLNDFGYIGTLIYIVFFYGIFDCIYYFKIKNVRRIRKSYVAVLLYGYFFYLIFMTFYVTTTVYLKMQTILEVTVMLVIFELLQKIRVK